MQTNFSALAEDSVVLVGNDGTERVFESLAAFALWARWNLDLRILGRFLRPEPRPSFIRIGSELYSTCWGGDVQARSLAGAGDFALYGSRGKVFDPDALATYIRRACRSRWEADPRDGAGGDRYRCSPVPGIRRRRWNGMDRTIATCAERRANIAFKEDMVDFEDATGLPGNKLRRTTRLRDLPPCPYDDCHPRHSSKNWKRYRRNRWKET